MNKSFSRRDFITSISIPYTIALLAPVAYAKKKKAPFPEIKACGSSGEIGMIHGKKLSKQIDHNIGFYLNYLSRKTSRSKDEILRISKEFYKVVQENLPHLFEEMEGIAKGSGRKLDEIMMINARTDILVMGKNYKSKKRHSLKSNEKGRKEIPGCTSMAFIGSRNRRKVVALGQNWDWVPALQNNVALIRHQRKGSPSSLMFIEAGMVGKIGFNENKLGVCLNFLSHSTDIKKNAKYGVPVHVLLRAMLESETIEQAYKTLAWLPRCASANFMLAQHLKKTIEIMDIEFNSTAIAKIKTEQPFLSHANHFIDKGLASGQDSSATSVFRDFRSSYLAWKKGKEIKDPVNLMKYVLKDRAQKPFCISNSIGTLAGIIMDLSGNRLFLCKGPPHLGRFIQIKGV